jgi:putative sterol carrier protein
MATARDFMDRANKRIEENKAQASTIGGVYKFVLHGDGGGTFIINLTDNPGVTEGEGAAQCTIKMSAKDYVDMIEGRADGRKLAFMGKLKIEGDLAAALKLQKISEMIR